MSILNINETTEVLRVADIPNYMTSLNAFSQFSRAAKGAIDEILVNELNHDTILESCHNAFEQEVDAWMHICKLKIYKMPQMIARGYKQSIGPHYLLEFNLGWYEHRLTLAFVLEIPIQFKATNPRANTREQLYKLYYQDYFYELVIPRR